MNDLLLYSFGAFWIFAGCAGRSQQQRGATAYERFETTVRSWFPGRKLSAPWRLYWELYFYDARTRRWIVAYQNPGESQIKVRTQDHRPWEMDN